MSKEEGFGCLGVTVVVGGEEVFWTKKSNFLSPKGSHLSTISLSGCNLSSINGSHDLGPYGPQSTNFV